MVATTRNPAQAGGFDKLEDKKRNALLSLLVRRYDGFQMIAAKLAAIFGHVDVTMINAGVSGVCSVEDISFKTFHTQVDTDFYDVVNVCEAFILILRAVPVPGSKHVFQVALARSRLGMPGLSA